ncbi:phosphocarrier HPr family protein [Anaerobacillus arseniciselenatis]|uniref:Phosphocarrier HPr family protein n=1 Tax=Anaerobacillus arseniciselenatis TaxID=85682 RepID=A0A1S2LNW6_9BACI|nr:HPr family phosphocarrier protein [Anaerobacillus arseniciselenatis]OIJ14046.1 phosphocarrier HPr family protein [Anaerobacillus arseniciselenatis]
MKTVSQKIIINISEDQTIIELSKLVQPYRSEIFLEKFLNGSVREINLKSFLGLITLRLQNKDQITIKAVGEDCEEALIKVVEYLT